MRWSFKRNDHKVEVKSKPQFMWIEDFKKCRCTYLTDNHEDLPLICPVHSKSHRRIAAQLLREDVDRGLARG